MPDKKRDPRRVSGKEKADGLQLAERAGFFGLVGQLVEQAGDAEFVSGNDDDFRVLAKEEAAGGVIQTIHRDHGDSYHFGPPLYFRVANSFEYYKYTIRFCQGRGGIGSFE